MPRYFFDLKDGRRLVDPSGLECRDDVDAMSRAQQIAGDLAAQSGGHSDRYVAVILDGQEIGKVPVKAIAGE